MPNRILRESITTSATIDGLSAEAEVLFYRLLVVADDYGRMDARPAVVLARCYPLRIDADHRSKLSTGAIRLQLAALQQAGLISFYAVGGKDFLVINQWDQHQRIRAKRARYPDPPSLANLRGHMTATGGHLSLARAESESESESEVNRSGGVPADAVTPPAPKPRVGKSQTRKPPPAEPANIDGNPGNPASSERSDHRAGIPPSSRVWNAYAASYAVRYGTPPVRNATVNAQAVQLVKRLGVEDAEQVAAYFVASDDPYYVRKGHTLGALLADAEKVRTEWATGKKAAPGPPALPWWKTEAGIVAEGARRGMNPRPGESMQQFLDRLRA